MDYLLEQYFKPAIKLTREIPTIIEIESVPLLELFYLAE